MGKLVKTEGCEYCKTNKEKVLHTRKCDGFDLEVFLTGNVLEVNSYNHQNGDCITVNADFEVRFCPMCGSELHRKILVPATGREGHCEHCINATCYRHNGTQDCKPMLHLGPEPGGEG